MRRALWALGLAWAAAAAADGADLERAKKIVSGRCFLCHGFEGESSSGLYPRLAGQHPEYIAKQLLDFKSGRRKSQMTEMVADLNDAEIRALGTYFSKQKPLPHAPSDPELTAVGRYLYHRGNVYSGVAACAGCHGSNGAGTPQLPRLAGQNALYTETQLKQFNTRERTNDNAVMHTVASKLTELEIKALAEYIAGME
ncbi:MAG: c-type cytochrome [Pseudomonadota bacterium]